MANPEALAILKQGSASWNEWRALHPNEVVDLTDADFEEGDFSGINLKNTNLTGAIIEHTDLSGARLDHACLSGASAVGVVLTGASLNHANLEDVDAAVGDFQKASFIGAQLGRATFDGSDLRNATFRAADLTGALFRRADLQEADFAASDWAKGACLRNVSFANADLRNANFTRAELNGADLSEANIGGANFCRADISDTHVAGLRFDRSKMRGKCLGIRGIDSCYGNALFRRAAADQDFLDTLELHWKGSWRMALFQAWSLIDYGRSLIRVAMIAVCLTALFGAIYSVFPELLNVNDSAKTWFTPFYFSVVTYTTLGFGDVKPATLTGEIIVSVEVILGYLTLGLLISVLTEKLARRG
jgi:uncharacterized protein YjbI with pentapeptide repeats